MADAKTTLTSPAVECNGARIPVAGLGTEIGARHGKTNGQVTLRWLAQHDGVAVIPRSSKRDRLIENASIFDFVLSDAEMQRVSSLAKREGRLTRGKYAPVWD